MKWFDCARCDAGYNSGPLEQECTCDDGDEEEVKHDRVHKDVGNARPAKVHRVTANEIVSAQQMTRKSKFNSYCRRASLTA